MAILGETFNDYVKQQIDVRQSKLALGNRDDNTLKFITSKTSFLRLTSGIDISEDKAQSLGVTGLSGPLLAQQYVLEAAKFNNRFTSNIGYSADGFSSNFNTSYGFNSDPSFGLVPPPGLTTATINTLNRGTLREATFNIICHNLYQFKIINALFLKLKYSLLLEWGHTLYFNNTSNSPLSTPIEIPNLSGDFLTGISSDQLLNKISLARETSCGNYDAFFGLVKNFNWELQENGSYNITVNAISQGDVIESLKVNTNLKPDSTGNIGDTQLEPQYQKSTLHNILGWIVRKLNDSNILNGYKETPESNALNTDTLSFITGIKPGYKHPLDTGETNTANSILTFREGIKVTFSKLQMNEKSEPIPQYYIKLGTILRIVEAFLLYYDTSKSSNTTGSPSIFYIDHDFDTNECLTTPRQISTNPLTCLIPFDFNNSLDVNEKASTTSVVYSYDTTTNVYQINVSADKSVSDPLLLSSETTTSQTDPPSSADENNNIVIDSSDGFGRALEAVTPFQTRYSNALRLIQLNASSLTGQTLTLTTQTITKKAQATISNAAQSGVLEYLDDSFRSGVGDEAKFIGKTMHIYVNINKIIEVLDSNIDSEGNVTVYNFLTQLLGEISRALCYINKFDLDYDESTNTFSVVDTAIMPLKYKNLEASKTAKFNINLLKDQTSGGGSFVTNFSLKSDVFSQISNAIALGAQGNGNTLISDSTPLSNFNKGLTDRIIVNKSNPNVDSTDQDKLFDNKYLDAYKKYLQYQIKLTDRSDFALTLEDIDLFNSYLVDLMKYDLGIYTKNAQLPGTGFIPLNLQLTMDGLSGMKQYQTFDIDETLLPQEYYNRLKFITTVISHKIDTKGWETTINTLGVPKNNDPKTDIQSAPIVKTETPTVTKKTVEIKEEITNASSLDGCSKVDGELDENIVTSTIVKDAYGGYIKGKASFISKVETAYNDLIKQGITLSIGDTYRSFDFQKASYDNYLNNIELWKQGKSWTKNGKTYPASKKPDKIADPCKGYHVRGQAMDIEQSSAQKKDIQSHGPIYQALYNAGLRRISNEWWHWSLGESDHASNKKFTDHGGDTIA